MTVGAWSLLSRTKITRRRVAMVRLQWIHLGRCVGSRLALTAGFAPFRLVQAGGPSLAAINLIF